jgi:hypothetical protein
MSNRVGGGTDEPSSEEGVAVAWVRPGVGETEVDGVRAEAVACSVATGVSMTGGEVEVGDEVGGGLVVVVAVGSRVGVVAIGLTSEVRLAVGKTAGWYWLLQAAETKPETSVLINRK